MKNKKVRMNVSGMPEELKKIIDTIGGKKHGSSFVCEAVIFTLKVNFPEQYKKWLKSQQKNKK